MNSLEHPTAIEYIPDGKNFYKFAVATKQKVCIYSNYLKSIADPVTFIPTKLDVLQFTEINVMKFTYNPTKQISYLVVGNANGFLHRFHSADNETWAPTTSTVYIDCFQMIGQVATVAFIKIDQD